MTYSNKYSEDIQEEIIHLRLRALEYGGGWGTVYNRFPTIPKSSVKDIFYRWERDNHSNGMANVPQPTIIGDTVAEEEIDEEEVWRAAMQLSKKRKLVREQRKNHQIIFETGPVALVFMADLHLGGRGVDYERVDSDINEILSTPGMYVCLVGDIIDNFIIGKLKDIRLGTSFTVSEEWALARRVLRLLAPRIILSVAGNHEMWTYALTNIDYLSEVHQQLNPDILYAKYDHNITVTVATSALDIRVRHQWRGYSMYNDTHGIERAAKFDKGEHFDIGIGAHTHASGLYRQFNNGGKTGHAVICGSYKFDDEYATRLGLPRPNEAAAVCTIICPDGEVLGTNSLTIAARYMRMMYSDN